MYNQCNYIIMATNDNNIEKSYEFVIYEGDKKFKRMYQAASPEEPILSSVGLASDIV